MNIPVVIVAAAASLVGIATAAFFALEPSSAPVDWAYPKTAPGWNSPDWSEVAFGSYDDREEGDFVAKRVLPAFDKGSGPPGASIGLFDAIGSGHFQVFVRLVGPEFCNKGCRTLVYAFVNKRWRLEADEPTVAVVGKPGEYVLFEPDGPSKSMTWDAAQEKFVIADYR